jgi:hypothetical protein
MYHGTTSKNVRVHLIVAAHPAMYFSTFLAPPLLPILVQLEILHCTNHLLSDLFSANCKIQDLSEKLVRAKDFAGTPYQWAKPTELVKMWKSRPNHSRPVTP